MAITLTDRDLFALIHARMCDHIIFRTGTYNQQDPTHYEKGTVYVRFENDPIGEPIDIPPEEGGGSAPPDEEAYEIFWHDVTWGVTLRVTSVFGQKQIMDLYLDMDTKDANRITDGDRRFLLELLQASELFGGYAKQNAWTNKKPKKEDFEPIERNYMTDPSMNE